MHVDWEEFIDRLNALCLEFNVQLASDDGYALRADVVTNQPVSPLKIIGGGKPDDDWISF